MEIGYQKPKQTRKWDDQYPWKRFLWGRTCDSRKWSESCPGVLGSSKSPGVDGIQIDYFKS